MPTYAADTTVSPEKSRAEIERTLARYGATAFMYGWEDERAVVQFRVENRMVRFVLLMPPLDDFRYTSGRTQKARARERDTEDQVKAREQAMKQRWRVLALAVKAKLESVEAGLETLEEAFMAHILLPDGSTVSEFMGPQIEDAYERGTMPKMLPSGA